MVSIVIPVFNRKEDVEKMLQSILNQTYKDWELILIDDGSIDEVDMMMEGYAKIDRRIRLYRRDILPKGGQTCRNIGFNLAKGKYIIFFDSDDLISSTCIEYRVDFMEKNKDIDFAIFPTKLFVDEEELNDGLVRYQWGVNGNHGNDDFISFLKMDLPFLVVTNIYRRSALLTHGISWDQNILIYQDFFFNFSTLSHGLKYLYGCNPDTTYDYYYRAHTDRKNVCGSHVSEDKLRSFIYMMSVVTDKLRGDSKYSKQYEWSVEIAVLKYVEKTFAESSPFFLEQLCSWIKGTFSYCFYFRIKLCLFLFWIIKFTRYKRIIIVLIFNMLFPEYAFHYKIKTKIKKIINSI